MNPGRPKRGRFRRRFLSGLLVVVPLVVTYLVLKFLFESIDGILAPVVQAVFKRHIPGVGLLATLLLVVVAGWITTGVAGGRLVKIWDGWMARLPLVRIVYSAAKQVVESVSKGDRPAFQQVGLLEYPRSGLYSICFLSNRIDVDARTGPEERISAFIPSTPTPFTGFVVLVRPEEVIPIDISVEDAIKVVVSGGIVAPPRLSRMPAREA
jgi:uncharacterized membrane protein